MDFIEKRCNICGESASAYMSLQVTSEDNSVYPVKPDEDGNIIFYVCDSHQYLFKRMSSKAIDLRLLFEETLEIYK